MNIIPFTCTECRVNFDVNEGGLCSKCGRPFCFDHLYEVKDGKNKICVCINDKGGLKGKLRKRPSLAFRRYFNDKQ